MSLIWSPRPVKTLQEYEKSANKEALIDVLFAIMLILIVGCFLSLGKG